MCLVGTREAEDSTKRLEAHYMIGDSRSRFIEEYKRLFQDNIRLNQMKSENKYKKMKIQQKMKRRIYKYPDEWLKKESGWIKYW